MRVIDIEWKTRSRGHVAQQVCVTQLVNETDIDNEDSQDNEEDDSFESYYINDELQAIIKLAPAPYNNGIILIEEIEDNKST